MDRYPILRVLVIAASLSCIANAGFAAGQSDAVRAALDREDWTLAQSLTEEQLAAAGSDASLDLLDAWVEAHSRGTTAADSLTISRGEEAVSLHAPGDEGHASAQLRLARSLIAARDYDRAQAILTDVLAVVPGSSTEVRVHALREQANLYNETGDPVAERAAVREALDLLEADPDAPQLLRASLASRWALVLSNEREFDEARAALEPVLPIYDELTPGDHPKRLRAWRRYANILVDSGDLEMAEPLLQELYEAHVRLEGARSYAAVRVLNDQGILYRMLGDNPAALDAFQEVAGIVAELRGPDHISMLVLHQNVANMDAEMGDLQGALDHYREAQRIGLLRFPDGHARITQMIQYEGTILDELGDHVAAEQRITAALDLFIAQVGPDHALVARAHNSLGNALMNQGRYGEALEHYEFYVADLLERNGTDSPEAVSAHRQRARVYATMGELELATVDLDRAIELGRKYHPEKRLSLNGALGDRSRLRIRQGEYALALEDAEECVERYRAEMGAHRFTINALADLARARVATDNGSGALLALDEASDLTAARVAMIARSSPEREALSYAGSLRPIQDLQVSLAIERSGDVGWVRAAWRTVARNRALVLDQLALRRQEAAALSPVALEELSIARRRLAQLYVQAVSAEEEEEHRARVERAEQRRAAAERDVARSVPASDDAGQLDWDAVRHRVRPGEALVAFVVYRSDPLIAEPGREVPAHLAAFVLNGGTESVVPLGALDEIGTLVDEWRGELLAGAQLVPGLENVRIDAYRAVATRLRSRIWDPLVPLVAGAERVHLVREGPLQRVDLYALPSPDGGWLLEKGPEFVQWTAERDLIEASPDPEEGPRPVLVVAGPDFDGRNEGPASLVVASAWRGPVPDCETFSAVEFAPLPHALQEGEEIARLWGETGADAKLLTGRGASEAAFKNAAPGTVALHLATHAWFVDPDCDPLAGRGAADNPHHPLLLSGMALTGFNQRESGDGEDGVLTAEEIVALDLSGVEQVVLSGCDTGAGAESVGDGILGLQRAFLLAGAKSLVMSLWPLDDAAARLWMESFYESRLRGGASLSRAIREAGIRAREVGGRDHPLYWAGYVGVSRN